MRVQTQHLRALLASILRHILGITRILQYVFELEFDPRAPMQMRISATKQIYMFPCYCEYERIPISQLIIVSTHKGGLWHCCMCAIGFNMIAPIH